jgi:hypothetical protein
MSRWRRFGGLGARRPPRCVPSPARPHPACRTPLRPTGIAAPSAMRCSAAHGHSHTVSERKQLQYSSTRLREGPGLNPRCPNCLTNGAPHLVPGAFAREQLPEAQHLSSSVFEWLRLFPRAQLLPTVKGSCSVTRSLSVRSRNRYRRTNQNTIEATAAPAGPADRGFCMWQPMDGQCSDVWATWPHAHARIMPSQCRCSCLPIAAHTSRLHAPESICRRLRRTPMPCCPCIRFPLRVHM